MIVMLARSSIVVLLGVSVHIALGKYPGEEHHEVRSLEGDVQNWAVLIENYILQLAYDGINQHYTQGYLYQAMYLKISDTKNGEDIVKLVKDNHADYFEQKKRAAEVKGYR